jgi:single-stranded DNA-specific DHH superfamily exonuclease
VKEWDLNLIFLEKPMTFGLCRKRVPEPIAAAQVLELEELEFGGRHSFAT